MKKPIYILGINFAYHELAACLIKNGELVAAVEEERFSRIKRGKKALINNPNVLPKKAIKFCLNTAGISLNDVSHIGLSFSPKDRLLNIHSDAYFTEGSWGSEIGEKLFYKKIMQIPDLINKMAGQNLTKRMHWIPHHLCHASSAFFVSPFKDAAILSIDGIGEFSSTWMGYGKNNQMNVVKEIFYPNSVGFLWEKISQYLGFSEYDSSKVMGLAAYGNPKKFEKVFKNIVQLLPNGEFKINSNIMKFRVDDFSELEKVFSVKKISSPSEITQDQQDIAAALQKITDKIIIHLSKYLKEKTQSENICLAGGVALNCVSNEVLMRSAIFKRLYVQPAANDAGTALGAAFYIWNQLLQGKRDFVMDHVYWGPGYSEKEILSALKGKKLVYTKSNNIYADIAQKLAEGNIIGWFQGKSEWGPRALGNRSLIADPRRADMKDILNRRIKRREGFRPFAPSVLKESAHEWFNMPPKAESISTEFMEINFGVKKSKQKIVPAITHADGTSRVQLVNKNTNLPYYKMIDSFCALTGVPLVLNTSFNDNEPIVCSPTDALKTFSRTKMDYLAMGDYLVAKQDDKVKLQTHTKQLRKPNHRFQAV